MEKVINDIERRCPRLGGPVNFKYCLQCGEQDLPCRMVFDCWWEYFDVVGYLQNLLTQDQFNQLATTRPKPKITSIISLIEKAKNS